MSHDLRGPIQSSIGLVTLMKMELKGGNVEALSQYLDLITDRLASGLEYVGDILNIAN